jgi:uncharacterized protein YdcH (DUF465 family)
MIKRESSGKQRVGKRKKITSSRGRIGRAPASRIIANDEQLEAHVSRKNNNKYDENIQNVGVQEISLRDKMLKMFIKYFEHLQ